MLIKDFDSKLKNKNYRKIYREIYKKVIHSQISKGNIRTEIMLLFLF